MAPDSRKLQMPGDAPQIGRNGEAVQLQNPKCECPIFKATNLYLFYSDLKRNERITQGKNFGIANGSSFKGHQRAIIANVLRVHCLMKNSVAYTDPYTSIQTRRESIYLDKYYVYYISESIWSTCSNSPN